MAQTYGEYRPTQFDQRGLGLPDQQNWIVAPVSRTRDSGPLSESNFHSVLKALGGESETVEVHRFGHWGPGWFEVIIVHPDRLAEVEEIEGVLENYPVFDDSDFSEREHEECCRVWESCYNERERAEYLRKHVGKIYPLSGYSAYSMLRAAVKGDWYFAANMLPCPSDLIA